MSAGAGVRALLLARGENPRRDGWRGSWRAALTTLLPAVALLGGCNRAGGATFGRPDISRLVEAALPAVVRVQGRGGMAQTAGSGFFIRGETGAPLIVTNHHVVWGAGEIAIERNDGAKTTATLVGVDPGTDLALLRPASGTAPATLAFGDDTGLRVGGWLVALGSSDGVFNAVSLGILSARGLVPDAKLPPERQVDHLFIDCGLGAGGSGGPVVDIDGRVIGVSLAMVGGSRNLGVALPSSLAAAVVKDIARGRRPGRPAPGPDPNR